MKQIRHSGLVVRDIEKAVQFYRDILGLKIQKQALEEGDFIDNLEGIKGVKVETIKMSADDGNQLELLHFRSPVSAVKSRGINDSGFSHIAFTVANMDQTYQRLMKAGVKFNSAPQVSPDNNARVVFCQDPEGNFIELVEMINKDNR